MFFGKKTQIDTNINNKILVNKHISDFLYINLC